MAPGRMHITNSGSAVTDTCSALPTCPETPRINRDLMQSSIYFNFLIFQFYFLIFALFFTRGCVVDLCSHARGENTGSDHCCQGCSAHSLLGLLFFFFLLLLHTFSPGICAAPAAFEQIHFNDFQHSVAAVPTPKAMWRHCPWIFTPSWEDDFSCSV